MISILGPALLNLGTQVDSCGHGLLHLHDKICSIIFNGTPDYFGENDYFSEKKLSFDFCYTLAYLTLKYECYVLFLRTGALKSTLYVQESRLCSFCYLQIIRTKKT